MIQCQTYLSQALPSGVVVMYQALYGQDLACLSRLTILWTTFDLLTFDLLHSHLLEVERFNIF